MNDQDKLISGIPRLWAKVEEANNVAVAAKSLAEYANKNIIEAVIRSQNAEKTANEIKIMHFNFIKKMDEKLDAIQDQARNQTKWMIGLFVTFTTIVIGLKIWM